MTSPVDAESAASDPETAEIRLGEKTLPLSVTEGTEGERAVDIGALRKDTGYITLDPGFGNTGACRSAITFIDGEKGILRYRGYPIEELAEHSTFLETAWLLMHGELPSKMELDDFVGDVTSHTMLNESFRKFMDALPRDAHPMPICAATVGALATFYQQPESEQSIRQTIVQLIAKMPTIAAYAYKHSLGQPFIYPRNDLDYSSNLIHMMFATPCAPFEVDPVVAKALDQLFILHADHEQNCSTSTVRLVGSSMANLFASISAGISALWGSLHGGANQKVVEMFEAIEKGGGDPEAYIARAKDPNDPTRLMGFGHRVYKNYDPRAAFLKDSCRQVLDRLDVSDKLLEIAQGLEEITLKDPYFVDRKLYPNVDFYSGVIYRALGIPVDAFTVMFAIGRLPGWIAQWIEMRNDPAFRIGRPRQIYTGANQRSYEGMSSR
ncbi:MAG: citrate synthase [Planctomycetota bacterium]|jgi:citrate synthase|nr:citrate synthase [Planctomycetota bacterium]